MTTRRILASTGDQIKDDTPLLVGEVEPLIDYLGKLLVQRMAEIDYVRRKHQNDPKWEPASLVIQIRGLPLNRHF